MYAVFIAIIMYTCSLYLWIRNTESFVLCCRLALRCTMLRTSQCPCTCTLHRTIGWQILGYVHVLVHLELHHSTHISSVHVTCIPLHCSLCNRQHTYLVLKTTPASPTHSVTGFLVAVFNVRQDVYDLSQKLPHIVKQRLIGEWDHLDFIWALDAATVLYGDIIKALRG